MAYLKAILLVLVFGMICVKRNFQNIHRKILLHVIWISLLFLLLPNLPFALSKNRGFYAFSTYLFSDFVFLSALSGAVAIYFLILSFLHRKIVRIIFNTCVGGVIFVFALLVQTSNEYFARDVSMSQKRFEAIADFFSSDNIQAGDHIYVESLHVTTSEIASSITYAHGFNSLKDIIYRASGVRINQYLNYESFYNHFKNSDDSVKIVYFSQAYFTGDAYIAIIAIKGNELTENWKEICVNSMNVTYFAPNKQFGISILSKQATPVEVEGQKLESIENYNYANLYFRALPEKCEFIIHGEQLYPISLTITNMFHSNLEPLYIKEFPKLYEKMLFKSSIKGIKSNPNWMRHIEEEAQARGVPLGTMLYIDATWWFEKRWRWSWHEGNTK